MENPQLMPDIKKCERCGGKYEDFPGGGCDCQEKEESAVTVQEWPWYVAIRKHGLCSVVDPLLRHDPTGSEVIQTIILELETTSCLCKRDERARHNAEWIAEILTKAQAPLPRE